MTIFISHSKQDTELVNIVRDGLGVLGTGLQAVVYEDLPKVDRGEDSRRIKSLIDLSQAVFLFQTPNTESSEFTKTWIQFEVGCAATLNKPLIACQQQGYTPSMPIAYFSDLAVFDHKKSEDLVKIQRIARLHSRASPIQRRLLHAGAGAAAGSVFGPLGAAVGAAGGLLIPWQHPLAKVPRVRCKCGFSYRFWGQGGTKFRCPGCTDEQLFEVRHEAQRS